MLVALPQDVILLGFCPTGPGGGVDNSCGGPGGGVKAGLKTLEGKRDEAKQMIAKAKLLGDKKMLGQGRRLRAQMNKQILAKGGKAPKPKVMKPKEAALPQDVSTAGGDKSTFATATLVPGSEKPVGNEGVNTTLTVKMSDGSTGYYKPKQGEAAMGAKWGYPKGSLAEREVACSELDKALGFDMVPETKLVSGKFGVGSCQQSVGPTLSQGAVDKTSWIASDKHQQQIAKAMVFDAAVGNWDRHGGNWLVNEKGDIKLIDNGFTFKKPTALKSNLMTLQKGKVTLANKRAVSDQIRKFLEDPSKFDKAVSKLPMIPAKEKEAMYSRLSQAAERLYDGKWPSLYN